MIMLLIAVIIVAALDVSIQLVCFVLALWAAWKFIRDVIK